MQLYDQQQQIQDVPATFRRNDLVYTQLVSSLAAGLTLLTQAASGTLGETNYAAALAGWIDVWGDLAGVTRNSGEGDTPFHARLPNMLLAARDSAVAIETWLQLIEGVQGIVIENSGTMGYTLSLPAGLSQTRVAQIVKNLAYVRPAGVPVKIVQRTGGTYLNTVDYYGATFVQKPLEATNPAANILAMQVAQTANARAGWTGGRVTGAYLIPGGKTFLGTVNYLGNSSYQQQRTVLAPVEILVRVPAQWQGGRVTGSYLAGGTQSSATAPPASTNNQLTALPDLLLQDPTVNPNLATPLTSP